MSTSFTPPPAGAGASLLNTGLAFSVLFPYHVCGDPDGPPKPMSSISPPLEFLGGVSESVRLCPGPAAAAPAASLAAPAIPEISGTLDFAANDVSLFNALRASAASLTRDLALLSAPLVANQSWLDFGYMSANDFCRERFDRSARWLQDLAFLGEALSRLPALAPALVGEGGEVPLGRVAALQVARVASRESCSAWLDLARQHSVRQLRSMVQAAADAGSPWPVAGDLGGQAGQSAAALPADECALDSSVDNSAAELSTGESAAPFSLGDQVGRPVVIHLRAADLLVRAEADTEVQISLPRAAAASFEEGLELHRAVTGRASSVTSFIEALVGEASSCLPSVDEGTTVPSGITTSSLDRWTFALPHAVDSASIPASKLDGQQPGTASMQAVDAVHGNDDGRLDESRYQAIVAQLDPAALAWAWEIVERVSQLKCGVAPCGSRTLVEEFQKRLALEGELERCMARLLASCPVNGRGRARAHSLAALGEEIFGVSRRTIQRRIGLRRALGWHPQVRAAYEAGHLGQQAAWLVTRALGCGPAAASLERAWVAEGKEVSVRRLQDEVRLIDLRRHNILAHDGDDYRRPPTDAEWIAALPCVPGATRARVEALGERARLSQSDNVFLRFELNEELATAFVGAVAAACSWSSEVGTPAAAIFLERGSPVPAWVGLLAMIQDFVGTWDDPRRVSRQANGRLYGRDRYRCMAPGCTARSGLELHHIKFRSRGGSDDDSNLTTLCRGHHRLGVHAGAMSVEGSAPLGLTWRLGWEEVGRWYRNDRLMDMARVN